MNSNQLFSRMFYPTLVLFAGIFLFTSCSSAFSFQKRRYTKGVYFSTASHRHQAEERTSSTKQKSMVNDQAAVVVNNVESNNILLASAVQPEKNTQGSTQPLSKSTARFNGKKLSNEIIPINQPIKALKMAIKKQQAADASKRGPIKMVFKIVILLLLIVLGIVILAIVGAFK
jgi:hypothetical protein